MSQRQAKWSRLSFIGSPTLAHRLQLQLVVLGGLPVFMVGLVLVVLHFRQDYNQLRQVGTNQAITIGNQATTYLANAQTTLGQLTLFSGFLELSPTLQQTLLQSIQFHNAYFSNIQFYDLQGKLLTSVSQTGAASSDAAVVARLGSCFKQASSGSGLGSICFGQPYQSQSNSKVQVDLAGALRNTNNQVSRVVVASLDLSSLSVILSQVNSDSQAGAYIIDSQKRVLVSKNPSLPPFAVLGQTNSGLGQLLEQFDQHNYEAGYGVISSYNGSSGDVIGVANPIPLLGWAVVVETSTGSAYTTVWQGLGLTLIILVATVWLVLMNARRLGRYLTKPLSLLTVAAR
jgi:hypothetical protein